MLEQNIWLFKAFDAMTDLTQQVLRTDAAGMPIDWINYQEAIRCYYRGQVLYSCGTDLYSVRGGINSVTGRQSVICINSIIAIDGKNQSCRLHVSNYSPPLSNGALFARDDYICLYCCKEFKRCDLSRDHVTPISQAGMDVWNNVVTACKRCNNFKAGRTPEQAGTELLAVPFTPTHAEYVYLRGRRVLNDQMEFLRAHFPRRSPLHKRLQVGNQLRVQ